jgi:hypothetical protein
MKRTARAATGRLRKSEVTRQEMLVIAIGGSMLLWAAILHWLLN